MFYLLYVTHILVLTGRKTGSTAFGFLMPIEAALVGSLCNIILCPETFVGIHVYTVSWIIPLSHYSKNMFRMCFKLKVSQFIVTSAGFFSLPLINLGIRTQLTHQTYEPRKILMIMYCVISENYRNAKRLYKDSNRSTNHMNSKSM